MICACIETSSAETGSSATMNSGSAAMARGDADALPLAAGELVREAVRHVGVEADDLQQFLYTLPHLRLTLHQSVHAHRLRDDAARGHAGAERRVWVLEDGVDASAHDAQLTAVQRAHLHAVELHLSLGLLVQLQDAPPQRALPAAALPHEAERLASAYRERYVVHGFNLAHAPLEHDAGGDREVFLHPVHFNERGFRRDRVLMGHAALPVSAAQQAT